MLVFISSDSCLVLSPSRAGDLRPISVLRSLTGGNSTLYFSSGRKFRTKTMAAQPELSFTFHKVREQCEQGSPEAWRAFLEFYSPLALHLVSMYLPERRGGREQVWQQVLSTL